MLTTLARLKVQAGIPSADTSQDAALLQWIGVASTIFRGEADYYIGGLISSVSVANPTVVTSYGHCLKTGDKISVRNNASTPDLDGIHTVTVLTPDTFTVPINVSSAGSSPGNFVRQMVEYYDAPPSRDFALNERPVISLTEIRLDSTGYYGQNSGFGSDTILDPANDYALQIGRGGQPTGYVISRMGNWSLQYRRYGSNLVSKPVSSDGSIMATYLAGHDPIPLDVMLAVEAIALGVRQSKGLGGMLASESYDYYSYTLADAGSSAVIGSVLNTLSRYRRVAAFG